MYKVLNYIVIVALVSSCSVEEPKLLRGSSNPGIQNDLGNTDLNNKVGVGSGSGDNTQVNSTQTNSGINLNDTFETKVIEKVHFLDLDTLAFRVNNFRVNKQTFMRSECPVLVFDMPEKADYLEFLRCPSDMSLSGGVGDNLIGVELGVANPAQLESLFRQNDYWTTLQDSPGSRCSLIAGNFVPKLAKVITDCSAPTGQYRYFARSCVDGNKLEGGGMQRNCSRLVTFSAQMDFKNERVLRELNSLASYEKLKDELEGKGRAIYFTTLEHNNALALCQTREKERFAAVKRKESINTILGFGMALGAEMFIPETGIAAVNSGQKTFSTLAGEMWEGRDSTMGTGAQIAGALNKLFSSPNDYPRSCTEAVKYADILSVQIQELKSLHGRYAILLDELESATKGLQGGEQ